MKVRNCPVVARLLSTGQQEPDQQACVAAKTAGFATVTQSGRQPGAIKRSLPKFMMHGTSVENVLEILVCGRIEPSPGICGDGIYGFDSYLKRSGYSAAMHDALKAAVPAADFLANRPDSGSSGPGNMVSHFDILISRIEFMFLVFSLILNFEMLKCWILNFYSFVC